MDFNNWASEGNLNEATVNALVAENLDDLEALFEVEEKDLLNLRLTIGMRTKLVAAVKELKQVTNDVFKTNGEKIIVCADL